MTNQTAEQAWCAGFLEAVGSFHPEHISAKCDRIEPLRHLKEVLGGRITDRKTLPFEWRATGYEEVKEVLKRLGPGVSKRVQMEFVRHWRVKPQLLRKPNE
jgi:hypothetical protein